MTETKCSAEGCKATTTSPAPDGWAWHSGWEGISDGFYCPKHGRAIEEFHYPTEPESDDEPPH